MFHPKNKLFGQKQYYLGITDGTLGNFDRCQAMLKVCAETDTEEDKWHQQEAQRILECIGLSDSTEFFRAARACYSPIACQQHGTNRFRI